MNFRFVLIASVASLPVIAACSASAPAPVPAPVAAPVADVFSCPDGADTPGVIANTIGRGYRVFSQDASKPLPACFVEAVARDHKAYPDSVVTLVLAMSDALLRRTPDDPINLGGRLSLLSRAKRYAEVPRTFDKLIEVDPSRATLENYRLALAGAQRANDGAARLRYLTAASRKFPSASSIVADYNIQRQVPRLRALIDTTRQVLRLSPSRRDAYATLASIYGNLDMPDSALANTRLALARGVPRNDVAPSLQSLVGVVMRKAQLYDAPDSWAATVPVARAIDTTLSTDASKYLLALALSQVAAHKIDSLRTVLGVTAGGMSANPAQVAPAVRTTACAALRRTAPMLSEASARLSAGGRRFSASSASAIENGITHLRGEYSDISRQCPG